MEGWDALWGCRTCVSVATMKRIRGVMIDGHVGRRY